MSPRRVLLVMVLALGCCFVPAAVPPADGTGVVAARSPGPNGTSEARVTAVYPNPVADGDAGEFVVLRFPARRSLANWSLGDDEGRARLPNATVRGRVALSASPIRVRNLTDARVVSFPDAPALANSGERLVLRRNNRTVDTLTYTDAPEGERGNATGSGLTWRPLGTTSFPIVEADGGSVRAFVLPDAPGVPVRTLAGAEERVLLAGYTLTSRRVAAVLANASRRGVDVRVLVDGAPVGGLSRREARTLDRLVASNVSVRVLGGEGAPYEYHHAKYAVVDDRALVTTENWKAAGTGGHSSRGWGAVVERRAVVEALVATFRADAAGRGTRSWPAYRRNRTFEPAGPPANGTFPTRFEPRRVPTTRVALLRAPDNAERAVVDAIDGATDSVLIEQVSVGGRTQPFLRAAVRAARRGVRVRVLLSGAWYVREDNRALVRWLDRRATREGLPLSARVARPRGRFEKVHAKAVVVDGDRVILGSLNWNNNSARDNREVALVLGGERVGTYYRRVFRADWRGGVWTVYPGLLVAVLVGVLVAFLAASRITFHRGP